MVRHIHTNRVVSMKKTPELSGFFYSRSLVIKRAGGMFSIDQTLDAQRIGILLGFGQEGVGVVLEANFLQ